MRHHTGYPMTQRDLLDLDRRRDSANDRFVTGRASDPPIACALDRLLDVELADGDGVQVPALRGQLNRQPNDLIAEIERGLVEVGDDEEDPERFDGQA